MTPFGFPWDHKATLWVQFSAPKSTLLLLLLSCRPWRSVVTIVSNVNTKTIKDTKDTKNTKILRMICGWIWVGVQIRFGWFVWRFRHHIHAGNKRADKAWFDQKPPTLSERSSVLYRSFPWPFLAFVEIINTCASSVFEHSKHYVQPSSGVGG